MFNLRCIMTYFKSPKLTRLQALMLKISGWTLLAAAAIKLLTLSNVPRIIDSTVLNFSAREIVILASLLEISAGSIIILPWFSFYQKHMALSGLTTAFYIYRLEQLPLEQCVCLGAFSSSMANTIGTAMAVILLIWYSMTVLLSAYLILQNHTEVDLVFYTKKISIKNPTQ